jgi:hypothetical protein
VKSSRSTVKAKELGEAVIVGAVVVGARVGCDVIVGVVDGIGDGNGLSVGISLGLPVAVGPVVLEGPCVVGRDETKEALGLSDGASLMVGTSPLGV